MKLIIDIDEEVYMHKKGILCNFFGCYCTKLDEIIYNGIPLEDNCFTCRYYDDKSLDIDHKCTECCHGNSKWENKYFSKGE